MTNPTMKTSPFNIGDVVDITDFGCIYSRYKTAFQHFGIMFKAKQFGEAYYIEPSDCKLERYNKHWIVADIAKHSINSRILIYHIKNACGDSLVIDGDGLKLVRRTKKIVNVEPRKIGE